MADELFALATIPSVLPAEGDYDAIYATVMETVRGRWFLEEFVKRNRNADTATVLSAIERIESVIRGDRAQRAGQGLRLDLLEIAKSITDARAEIADRGAELSAGASPLSEAERPDRPDATAAQRLQDIASLMRGSGLDGPTCQQIEAIAASILATSSLRHADSERAVRLGHVLSHLEHRINAMLEGCASEEKIVPENGPSAEADMPEFHAVSNGSADPEQTTETMGAAAALTVADDQPPAPDLDAAIDDLCLAAMNVDGVTGSIPERPAVDAVGELSTQADQGAEPLGQDMPPAPQAADDVTVLKAAASNAEDRTAWELELDPIVVVPIMTASGPPVRDASADEPLPPPPSTPVFDAAPTRTETSPHGRLSAAWELARPGSSEATVAAPDRPASTKAAASPRAPSMWETTPAAAACPEPADFLLEPLEMPIRRSAPPQAEPPARASAAPPPTVLPVSSETPPAIPLAELDDELFAEQPAPLPGVADIPTTPRLPRPGTEPHAQPPGPQYAPPAPPAVRPPAATFRDAITAVNARRGRESDSTTLNLAPAPDPLLEQDLVREPASIFRDHAVDEMPRPRPYDPLAALNALTDEERIALFT